MRARSALRPVRCPHCPRRVQSQHPIRRQLEPARRGPLHAAGERRSKRRCRPRAVFAGRPAGSPAGAPLGGEPIVVPNCYVQYEDRQQVSAEVDGKIELIGSPLHQAALMASTSGSSRAKRRWSTTPPHPHPSIVFHPRDRGGVPEQQGEVASLLEAVRRHVVAAGQILCMLDDQVVTAEMNGRRENHQCVGQDDQIGSTRSGFDQQEDRALQGQTRNGSHVAESRSSTTRSRSARFSENWPRH